MKSKKIIYLDDAIDALEKAKETYIDRRVIIGKMQDILNDLPSAQPEPKWIPCSERLPEEGAEVFVYLYDRPSPYIAWVDDGDWYTEDFEVDERDYPTAWMPLPEPYQEGEQDG